MKFLLLFILVSVPFFTSLAQEGEVKTYYSGGIVESNINYKNNVRDGEAKFYYADGKLKQECSYVNGRIEGLIKNYYENGNLKELINIENGKREGPTTLFDEQGLYLSDLDFHEGIRIVPGPFEKTAPPDTGKELAASIDNNIKVTQNLLVPPPLEEKAEGDPDYFTSAEVMPQPVGGMASVYKRLVYPREAKENRIEGTVKVLLFISEWGDVVLTEIVQGIGYGCDESAKTVLFYTKFSPGLMRGKAVRTKIEVPIEFKLPPEED